MLRNLKTACALAIMLVAGISSMKAQTLKTPAPSPSQTIKQAFALSEITVEYSRPGAKGRVIFGNVVPFDKIWRTGANSATKITFGEDVKIEGNAVPAGTYALYTVPGKKNWDIMLYKDLKLGGNTSEYKKENELIRFTVKAMSVKDKAETFTINIADVKPSSANVELIWQNTKVAFNVVADIDTKIMKNIDNAVAGDTLNYFAAANYYYENGKDLTKALTWVKKAAEKNPKAFWVLHLQAKIEYKMKDYAAAIATSEKVKALASEAKNDDYVKMADGVIADAKKGK